MSTALRLAFLNEGSNSEGCSRPRRTTRAFAFFFPSLVKRVFGLSQASCGLPLRGLQEA